MQCLHLACQASGHTVVTLPELHRWSAHPAFFEDATRQTNPAASPLTLFGSGGISTGAQAAAVKGQGHRLVSLVSRGMKELSSDARQRLVDAWQTACRSSTPHLRQVRSRSPPGRGSMHGRASKLGGVRGRLGSWKEQLDAQQLCFEWYIFRNSGSHVRIPSADPIDLNIPLSYD
jgi:hypothetical protein